MTGTTNQIQTPFGTGVRTALGLATGAAGGLMLTPVNPSISYTGTWLSGFQFSIYNAAVVNNAGFTANQLAATFDDILAETGLLTLNLGNIQQINGSLSAVWAAMTSISAPNLVAVTGALSSTFPLATTFSFPNLVYVNGNCGSSCNSLVTMSYPALQYVNGAFNPVGTSLTTLSAPNLLTVGGNFAPNMALCTTFTFTNLTKVIGNYTPTFAALTTMSLPAIVSLGGTVTVTAANLVNFSFGSILKSVGSNVTMTGMALNQASVDGILVSLAALDGTGGTTAYSSKTVNLSGGTSSTPSATGLAAKATLVGRSCTVTTN